MRKKKHSETTPRNRVKAFEHALAQNVSGQEYVLTLFIAGASPCSARAVASVDAVCREHLAGHYQLHVIDIHQQPAMLAGAQIIAAPTLVKTSPPPLRRMIGNLGEPSRILQALNVVPLLSKTPAAT